MMSMAVRLTDRYVYVVDDSPKLRRYDVTTRKRDAKIMVPVPRKDVIIAVSPKGKFIAVSHITNTGIINLRRKKFDRPVTGVSNRVISFTVFTIDGKSFYQGGNDP